MKNLILPIAVIILSVCASMPTVKSMAGTYEEKEHGDARLVLLKNGIFEAYEKGKKDKGGKWKINKEDELHLSDSRNIFIVIVKINKDGSITIVARIDAFGKRVEFEKEEQLAYKRIK